uniref:Translation initiation factor IF-2, chloroplastic n=1 Tax=Cryptomonas curvata TaxID=233186 RepID=A0A222AHE1_9CRYP|nr:translation initiation factor 2 [Cryptomonas curvata]ASO75787.1 translation initiation factor 2 [Cryptomonas curvata]
MKRDIDRTGVKLKLKKKTRSKVTFDEDYESVSDLLGAVDIKDDILPLPLARPSKPAVKESEETSFTIKQRSVNNPTIKKKSTTQSSKRDLYTSDVEKPTSLILNSPKTVEELAEMFGISTTDIIKSLFLKGVSVNVNQVLDLTTIQNLGQEFGVEVSVNSDKPSNEKKRLGVFSNGTNKLVLRPPVVTVMGHVDHGKTTLLDKIRKTQIAKREAGGITQKIGAYEVSVSHKNEERKLIFLDTPGHAAFSGMRIRGVSITDIAVLVVAADDGVKPQTLEAIQHIQASKVPIIVAINKIDKEDANVDSIKEELAKQNLISEDWGGDTLMVPISAMQGTNIDTLLEMILLLSDVMELKADPTALAEGTIIESNLDRTRGAVASVLIQNGTLNIGDVLYLSGTITKVRGMINSFGENIQMAGPASPVFLWGLTKVPSVGDHFTAFKYEKDAKLFASLEESKVKLDSSTGLQVSEHYNVSESEAKLKINLIIKTDTQGSAEAISSSLNKINDSKVHVRVLYSCAGEVTETDVEFASTSSATLIAFNTTSASGAMKTAKNMGISIKSFDVIYDLFDFVQSLVDSLAGPEFEERFLGSALIRTVFPLAKSFVAGSFITEGKIVKSSFVHIIRNNEVIHKGFIDSIKRVKESVLEVSQGSECGIFLKEFDSWKEGDIIRAFELIPKKKTHFKISIKIS